MTEPPHSDKLSEVAAKIWETKYEELRRTWLMGVPSDGAAIVVRQGLAAWLRDSPPTRFNECQSLQDQVDELPKVSWEFSSEIQHALTTQIVSILLERKPEVTV